MATAAVAAVNAGLQIITSLFHASQERAQEAASENEAVAEVLQQSVYPSMAQIAAAYNAGDATQSQALSYIDEVKNLFWQQVTPKIQPGRNGCSSGTNCPSSNGTIPQGYCSGNIGAACCLGCWTIEKIWSDAETVIRNGSGIVQVVPLNITYKTFSASLPAQEWVFTAPPSVSNIVSSVQNSVNAALGISSVPGQTINSSSNLLIYAAIAATVLFIILIAARRRS